MATAILLTMAGGVLATLCMLAAAGANELDAATIFVVCALAAVCVTLMGFRTLATIVGAA